jgi:protein-S-isoprenylcysteine O-methyltransferase Ste14
MTDLNATPKPHHWITPARLDRFEQVAIVILWMGLIYRMVDAVLRDTAPPWILLLLVAETTVMIFTLIRRPTSNISVNWRDWILAAGATFLPLLILPGAASAPPLLQIGIILIMAGNTFQILAKLFLRRSFGVAPANRGIKTDGPYRLVRHPMYGGYLIVHIGSMILIPSWINFAIYAGSWGFQIFRLLAEERLLSQDPAYAAYMEKVRWRLLPGVF